MRFCSAPVQAARFNGDLLEAIVKEKYLGVYVPAEGLNTHKFTGKGQSDEAWSAVFSMYFETWLVTSLLTEIRTALKKDFFEDKGQEFRASVSELFHVSVNMGSINEIYIYLVDLRKNIDAVVRNSAISSDISSLHIPFTDGSLIFGIPNLLAAHFPKLGDPIFVYLVDELENFTADQQKFLNTLIRYRKGRATIKIGARLYGIKTMETLGSGEPIKPGSEFEQVELDKFLRDQEEAYREFAVALILRRLQQAHPVARFDADTLPDAFEQLDTSDNWKTTTLQLMRPYDLEGRDRPHIKNFRRKLAEAKLSSSLASELINILSFPDHPLLEKTNLFLFSRRWDGKDENVTSDAHEIADEAKAYAQKDRNASKAYAQALGHFNSDLIAQMYREARQRLPYAGIDTLIELSEGIPRNLLGMLALSYRQARFSGERPFDGGKISVTSQTQGVMEGAKFFWNDAQPDVDASDVRDAIEALALLFRSIRFSDAPSECDLCTFSVNMEKLTERSRAVLRIAENWSHLIRIPTGSKNKNTRSIDAKFQFSPMLAPLWEISHHRRGAIELQPALANAILDPEHRNDLVQLVRSRIEGMSAPRLWQRGALQNTFL